MVCRLGREKAGRLLYGTIQAELLPGPRKVIVNNLKSEMPLTGLTVLDCATLFAGPLLATMLGDFGAEVIKVEHHAAIRCGATATKRTVCRCGGK